MLRCLVKEKIGSWDLLLSQAEFAYNSSVNRTTGMSPFQIVYGRVPLFPADISFHAIERESEEANDFMRDRTKFFKQVQEQLQVDNQKYKEQVDKKKREKVFEVGDLVWVYVSKDRYPTGEYNKLKARKIGPCKILRRINENAYEVELSEGWNINNSFNVADLYEFQGWNEDVEESNNFHEANRLKEELGDEDKVKGRKIPLKIIDEQEIRM